MIIIMLIITTMKAMFFISINVGVFLIQTLQVRAWYVYFAASERATTAVLKSSIWRNGPSLSGLTDFRRASSDGAKHSPTSTCTDE